MNEGGDMLSHYTNEEGFIGIARSQSLRATEFVSLNDTSEFSYAFKEICRQVYLEVMRTIPPDLIAGDFDQVKIESMVEEIGQRLLEQVKQGDGYGSLYITSFARGGTQEENEEGILTLWDRYTKNEGYCLQFDEGSVRRVLEHEAMRNSYDLIELSEVTYGISSDDAELAYIKREFVQRMLVEVHRISGDARVAALVRNTDIGSRFIRRFMSFCARHKNPAFRDEREVRILAYPAGSASIHPLTGIAARKEIYTRRGPDNRRTRFIVIAEHLLPGFIPDNLIIGPKTRMLSYLLDAVYPLRPRFRTSRIPVR